MFIVESNRGRFDLARSWRYPGEFLTGLSRYGSIASRVSSKDLAHFVRHDLVFIMFASALLVVAHLFAQVGGLSNVVVDLAVTAFIGQDAPVRHLHGAAFQGVLPALHVGGRFS